MSADDDGPIGEVLSRRRMLGLLGAAGAMLLPACGTGRDQPGGAAATTAQPAVPTTAGGGSPPTSPQALPSCVVRPAQTEGPYFVDTGLNRSDIRADPSDGSVRPGAPLRITFNVSRVGAGSCTALAGAVVDVWHCDAAGVYSGTRDPGFDTVGQKFLRGHQVTDGSGRASFGTIYPGWYRGRAVHVHFKVRNDPAARPGFDFTSQLYFDEAVTDQVYAQAPYAAQGEGWLRNVSDGIFRSGGSQLLLTPVREGQGWAATFDLGVQV